MSNQLIDLDRRKVTTLVRHACETERMPAELGTELMRTLNPQAGNPGGTRPPSS